MLGKPKQNSDEEIRLWVQTVGFNTQSCGQLVVWFPAHCLATLFFIFLTWKIGMIIIILSTHESDWKELVGQLEHPWDKVSTMSQGFAIIGDSNRFWRSLRYPFVTKPILETFFTNSKLKKSQSPTYKLQMLPFLQTAPDISSFHKYLDPGKHLIIPRRAKIRTNKCEKIFPVY